MRPLAKTITHALAAFGMASLAISPAVAGEGDTMTIAVKTTDLDLGTVKGQRALDQRIGKAVRTVCRTTSVTSGSRMLSQDAAACLAKARSDASRQVAILMSNEQRGG